MSGYELVWDERALLGEGPIWNEREQCLHWVDVEGGALHTYRPDGDERESTRFDARISAVALREAGGLLVAHDRSVSMLADGALLPFAPAVSSRPRTNDGACDDAGRFWFGTVAPDDAPGTGVLYRLDPHGRAVQMLDGIGISNGIDWSLDGGTMYYIDSVAGGLDAFSFDAEAGTIASRRRIAEIDPADGVGDGLTVDSEGMIWVAIWGGWSVRRYSPQGDLLLELGLPVSQVSSCAFGGTALQSLYVTSARTGLSADQLEREPHAGGLFRFELEIRGRAPFRFAG